MGCRVLALGMGGRLEARVPPPGDRSGDGRSTGWYVSALPCLRWRRGVTTVSGGGRARGPRPRTPLEAGTVALPVPTPPAGHPDLNERRQDEGAADVLGHRERVQERHQLIVVRPEVVDEREVLLGATCPRMPIGTGVRAHQCACAGGLRPARRHHSQQPKPRTVAAHESPSSPLWSQPTAELAGQQYRQFGQVA